MLATTIRSPPSVDDYVPLSEYQSQTPESFSDGKPVLHFHLKAAVASIPKSQCGILAIFPADSPAAGNAVARPNGDAEELVEQTVDVFVNSEKVTLFSEKTESGVSIPYPSISIHAVKQVSASQGPSTAALWMQLEFSDGGADDDDFNTVELTILPSSSESPRAAQQLYDAIANCSNLHPDPISGDGDGDEDNDYDGIVFEGSVEHEAVEGFTGVLRGTADGGLPPPMPGSGGWITAENVDEYFDEDGSWIGGNNGDGEAGALGDGAGRTRPRDEVDDRGVNGDDAESKRPRVE
ncbi:FPD1, benzoylformate decarboxylase [Metarhizium album ARSEF 1941]|uniref:FPD1, benzoylformate decarboxylase n=1 Tax=Metarhizium album (strain ARSEF 1941) TaxID=1081103 RepID=A0A0B2WNT1_METAS|nr:FPD1, benzoylformate decarboxylase [Metarhizium album ARSEF 1941]KHN95653.1 FPD1, benzoylformate decarboxylase [Metarhizium album ARSEF 1941]